MKRFLMLVGVAVVAAAMYVAASPASQQSKGPTAKQFKALEKQVATLSKSLKAVKSEANAAAGFISDCFVSANSGVLPINEFGDPNGTFGYQFTATMGGTVTSTTALDVDQSTPFKGAYVQGVDPACVTPALRHASTRSGQLHLMLRAERAH
jgi:outer membrane murein-binding lipoprotein Lpp